jgi:hypothetical protein
MIRTVWMETDMPGVYVNGGATFEFSSTDLRMVILVFAVAWAMSWALMMVTS